MVDLAGSVFPGRRVLFDSSVWGVYQTQLAVACDRDRSGDLHVGCPPFREQIPKMGSVDSVDPTPDICCKNLLDDS